MSEGVYQNDEFIGRLKDAFDEMVLYKDLQKSNFIASFKLPSFMRDWVIKRFQDDKGNIDTDEAGEFIREFIPKKDDWKSILNRVVNFHETVRFLGKISVDIKIKNQTVTFRLPDFGLDHKETIIPKEVWDNCCDDLLRSDENWGIIEIGYYMPEDEKDPCKIKLVSYRDFCPYDVSLEDYNEPNGVFSFSVFLSKKYPAVSLENGRVFAYDIFGCLTFYYDYLDNNWSTKLQNNTKS